MFQPPPRTRPSTAARDWPRYLFNGWKRLACGVAEWHASAMLAYAVTIFVGAFLLFQVQPLIGKFILPWFGGGPGVWTTCMLFFQMLLLGGYAYAHAARRHL